MAALTIALPTRGGRLVRLGAAAAVLASAAATTATRAQGPGLPDVTGPAPVGRTELALTDTGRLDPFADDGRDRELAVWIWYPAMAGSAGAAAPFLPPTWAQLANGTGLVTTDLTALTTHAIAGAPLDGRPPVVVLLPGLGQPVAAYTSLAEDLASHGYAVVGINPTGSTSVVEFPDGHLVPATPAGGIDPALLSDLPGWSAAAERVTQVWAADAAFVVEALAATPPPIGALDLDRVAYVGHSLGGAAAFAACAQVPSCGAAVDLDGTLWTDVRLTGLATPALLLQASRDACDAFCEAATADFATVEAAGPLDRAVIDGSRHMSFTDLGLLGVTPGSLDLGTIDLLRMSTITRDLVRSFLDEHVAGAPAGTYGATAAAIAELR